MTPILPRRRTVLAAAVTAVFAVCAISQANAQFSSDRSQRRADRKAAKQAKEQKQEEQFPGATRKPETTKASTKATKKLQKMFDLYEGEKREEARAIADEILATEGFNAYDKSLAAQVAGQIVYDTDDYQGALDYWNKALTLNGLDNNAHYGLMFNIAQVQTQQEKYAEALATMERLQKETNTQKPEHLAIKGNVLYQLERYPEAVAALKQAVDASPEPRSDWQQLLMAAYVESGQGAQAIQIAEQIAAKTPNDKRAQKNLAAVYMQNDMNDKAIAVLEKMRAAGQLTEESDYRNLYATYYNMDGRQKDVVAVINEGMQKGILKQDHQNYLALAQAHYELEQIGPSIEAFRKAAPLDDDGETYLNLARLLWQEDRIPEAKVAAKQAVAKGLKKPEEARKILALPGK